MVGYSKIIESCLQVVCEKNPVDYKVCLEWPISGVPRVNYKYLSDKLKFRTLVTLINKFQFRGSFPPEAFEKWLI